MHLRLIILTISFQAFISACPASAKVIYVSPDATGDGSGSSWGNACTTITAGLAASASGDEIWVKSAVYPEAIEMKEGVALYGGFPVDGSPSFEQRDWRANETIIDATGLNTHIVVGADFAALDGFTITGGLAGRGGGVYCENAFPSFTNCTIIANRASGGYLDGCGGGVYCQDSSPIFVNCRVIGNRSEQGAGGLYFTGISSVVMINCIVASNRSDSGAGGVYLSPLTTVTNCTLTGNQGRYGAGGVAGGGDSAKLANCILWNVNGEISDYFKGAVTHCCVRGGWPGEGNFGAEPEFLDPVGGDYSLQNGSRCIDRGSVAEAPAFDIDGNPRPGGDGAVDIGAYEAPEEYEPTAPRVYYAWADASPGGDGLSWGTAFQSIQAGLNAAEALDEVWVAAGTYHEAVQLIADRAVYGGFTGGETKRSQRDWLGKPTIIDARSAGEHALTGQHQTIINGFTVLGAAADTPWCRVLSGEFGTVANCILIGENGSVTRGSPVFINCTITGSLDFGLDVRSSSATLVGCTISDNLDGGIYFFQSTGTLRNCSILRNSQYGFGSRQSNVLLEQCEVSDNSGLGVFSYLSHSTLRNCRIVANHSDGVKIAPSYAFDGPYTDPSENLCAEYVPLLTNCIVAHNTGYGVYCYRTTPILANCTIADNTMGGVISSEITIPLYGTTEIRSGNVRGFRRFRTVSSGMIIHWR